LGEKEFILLRKMTEIARVLLFLRPAVVVSVSTWRYMAKMFATFVSFFWLQ